MGLYRTIPQDVEAVQFGGMDADEPILREMGPSLPSWLWRGITKGVVTFDSAGVKVHGQVLKANDWIIYDGVFISTTDDEKFKETFTPARKPLSQMASAPKSLAQRTTTVEPEPETASEPEEPTTPTTVAVPLSAPPPLGVSTEEIPDDVDAIINRLNGQQDVQVA